MPTTAREIPHPLEGVRTHTLHRGRAGGSHYNKNEALIMSHMTGEETHYEENAVGGVDKSVPSGCDMHRKFNQLSHG